MCWLGEYVPGLKIRSWSSQGILGVQLLTCEVVGKEGIQYTHVPKREVQKCALPGLQWLEMFLCSKVCDIDLSDRGGKRITILNFLRQKISTFLHLPIASSAKTLVASRRRLVRMIEYWLVPMVPYLPPKCPIYQRKQARMTLDFLTIPTHGDNKGYLLSHPLTGEDQRRRAKRWRRNPLPVSSPIFVEGQRSG